MSNLLPARLDGRPEVLQIGDDGIHLGLSFQCLRCFLDLFVESVQAMHPFYIIRFLGGVLFLSGAIVMAYNLWKTVAGAKTVEAAIPAPAH